MHKGHLTMITVALEYQRVIEALNRLTSAGTSLKPAMQDIGEYMVGATKQRFGTGTAPDGSNWAANSALTAKLKGHNKPLIGESKRLSNEIHYNASADGIEIGSSLIYAATQQFGATKGSFGTTKRGGPIPWQTIPARPFLGVSTTDANHITDILREHLAAAIK